MRGEKILSTFKEYVSEYRSGDNYRREIYERDDYKCVDCGIEDELLEVHHIQPVSGGGDEEPENLKLLCYDCHLKAHNGCFGPTGIRTGKTVKNVGFSLKKEIVEELERYSEETKLKKSVVVNIALREYFKKESKG